MVPEASANPGFGQFTTLQGIDHINVCKPRSKEDVNYAMTVNFLQQCLSRAIEQEMAAEAQQGMAVEAQQDQTQQHTTQQHTTQHGVGKQGKQEPKTTARLQGGQALGVSVTPTQEQQRVA